MGMPFQIIIFILLKVKCQMLTINCTPDSKAIILRGGHLTRTKLWHYRVWLGALEPPRSSSCLTLSHYKYYRVNCVLFKKAY